MQVKTIPLNEIHLLSQGWQPLLPIAKHRPRMHESL